MSIFPAHVHQEFAPPDPGSTAHTAMITASKIPTILGLSEWETRVDLFHRMAAARRGTTAPRDATPWEDRDPLLVWGHVAETSLAQWWWVRRGRHDGYRLSSTHQRHYGIPTGELSFSNDALPFPNLATLDRLAFQDPDIGAHIIECKTNAASVAAATWQVAAQMLITGIPTASIIHLSQRRPTPQIIDVTADQDALDWLTTALTTWHHHLTTGTEPAPHQFAPPTTFFGVTTKDTR